jgi:hypothetical protein
MVQIEQKERNHRRYTRGSNGGATRYIKCYAYQCYVSGYDGTLQILLEFGTAFCTAARMPYRGRAHATKAGTYCTVKG